ncbi:gibberellin 2-beta-dioxygenase 2-like [Prosopis cineraria]|uniref:gibberellin 2-beta-dioxygenase 2-like n=1 Tax=Prosopis cineraria TaxID=364024 RepID=UPI00240F149E|nr:gibberellin 2-beta-dioxygenase 2-like [Prosopis cineraria]
MFVPSVRTKKTSAVGIPTIDLSMQRSELSELAVRACEQYGIFKVVNHRVPKRVLLRLEEEGNRFFSQPVSEKLLASPAAPFGYGSRNIGSHGDVGELEYLLLHTDPQSISQVSKTISSKDPAKFSCAVNEYIEAAREVACEILELVAEGLRIPDKMAISRLIRDAHSDSVLRLNHYPATDPCHDEVVATNSIGFGEHSDPQILTVLRSNDVSGLQISTQDGLWIPVPPDPFEFVVMVGDSLQALTNGRFRSVRHRAVTSGSKSRMSMIFFGAPALNSWITPLPVLLSPHQRPLYKPFTWAQYKQAAYSLALQHARLDLFKAPDSPLLISASP